MKLKELRDFADTLGRDFPNMNYGGCCVLAAMLAPKLAEHFKDVRIRVQETWPTGANVEDVSHNWSEPQPVSDEWEGYGVEFNHVYVDFLYRGRRYSFDAQEGVQARKPHQGEYTTLPGCLPLKHAQALAARAANWNPSFPRRRIPELRNLVEDFFERAKQSPLPLAA